MSEWTYTVWHDGIESGTSDSFTVTRRVGKPPLVTLNGSPVAGHLRIVAQSGDRTIPLLDAIVTLPPRPSEDHTMTEKRLHEQIGIGEETVINDHLFRDGRFIRSTFGAPAERDAIGTVRISGLKASDDPVRVVLGSDPSKIVGEVTEQEQDGEWLTFTMRIDGDAWNRVGGNPEYHMVGKADGTLLGISLAAPGSQTFIPIQFPDDDTEARP